VHLCRRPERGGDCPKSWRVKGHLLPAVQPRQRGKAAAGQPRCPKTSKPIRHQLPVAARVTACAWLKVLGRYLHLEERNQRRLWTGTSGDKGGRCISGVTQWEVVNPSYQYTRAEGPGKGAILIQHTLASWQVPNSIAWTAHQTWPSLLRRCRSCLFNSVIVITDRTVWIAVCRTPSYQFEHCQAWSSRVQRETAAQSKSEQLAEALAEQTPFISSPSRTFPALFDALGQVSQAGQRTLCGYRR